MKSKEQWDRRGFLKGLSLAALGGLATEVNAGILPQVTDSATEDPQHVLLTPPYLQAPVADGITVSWINALPSISWVEYGEEQPDKKVYDSKGGLITANNRVNAIRLQGLIPGKTYSYRVVSKRIIKYSPWIAEFGETVTSPIYRFTLPDPQADKVEFAILNDIHDKPGSIPLLLGLDPGPVDYVLLNGDMFNAIFNEQQLIDHFIRPSTDTYASTVPMLFSKGNHEARGIMARELDKYFVTRSGMSYFCQRLGPVFTIVLDSGEDKPDSHPAYMGLVDFDAYIEQQHTWLQQVMETEAYRTAPFRVVFVHIPPYHTKKEAHGILRCRARFSPLFAQHKVDLVICGHTHSYGVHPPDSDHSYPIVIGGGPKENERTLMRLSADRQLLTVRLLADNGKQVGHYEVKRGIHIIQTEPGYPLRE